VAGIAAAGLSVTLPTPRAHALFGIGDVVFDPQNFAQAVEQVANQLELIVNVKLQLEAQLKALQNWEFTRIDDIRRAMNAAQNLLRTANEAYEWLDPGPILDDLFPTDLESWVGVTQDDFRGMHRDWVDAQRESVTGGWTVQNTILDEMESTGDRVGQYIGKSNAAPGTTAAVQASNELLATVTGQLQQLQSLQISHQRLTLEEVAQEQAEDAFAEQRREAVMSDWAAPPPGRRDAITTSLR
jgi:P-type conjugative transfer protein TrbJ